MKTKTHLQTKFIQFILDKYQDRGITDEEDTNVSDEEIIDEIDEIEIPDEVKDEEDDETIEDLIKEYNEMEEKYKTLRNDKVHNKRR